MTRLIRSTLVSIVATTAVVSVVQPAQAAIRGTCSEGDTYVLAHPSQSVMYYTTMPSYFGESFHECTLRQGTGYNRAVVWLQAALRDCHGQRITADGVFGAATKQALVNVQVNLGITADGVYGPQTWRALGWPVWEWRSDGRRFRSVPYRCANA